MLKNIRSYIMYRKIIQSLRTHRLRNGLNHFRNLLIGEYDNIETNDAKRYMKLLISNENTELVDILSRRAIDSSAEFNKVANLYPYIISNMMMIIEETERMAKMHNKTRALESFTDYEKEWNDYKAKQEQQLSALYMGYPHEMYNIFNVFGEFLDPYVKLEAMSKGSFHNLLSYIENPATNQIVFKDNISYFMSFCELINGK